MPSMMPPVWDSRRLRRDARKALDDYVSNLLSRRHAGYSTAFRDRLAVVNRLFDATDDLRSIRPSVVAAIPEAVEVLRYLVTPPLSEDDLDTLVGQGVTKRRRISSQEASRILRTVRRFLDRERRSGGILSRKWTASLMAVERTRTRDRMEGSAGQQEQVTELVKSCGYQYVNKVSSLIEDLEAIPRGCFTRERRLGPAKCDVPVRLADGRLLAIECKVSNSAVNSVKRLLRETGGKARQWADSFGRRVITAAVLAGVYKPSNLEEAQREHQVAIFWQHDLGPLRRFLLWVRRASR